MKLKLRGRMQLWPSFLKRVTIALLMITIFCGKSFSAGIENQINLEKRVNLQFKNTRLDATLESLTKQTGTNFILIGSVASFKVSLSQKMVKLGEALELILTPHQLTYRIIDNDIVIKPHVVKQARLEVIKGKITDENGNPLPGVNVKIKDKSIGAVSNLNGEFTIESTRDDVLVVSFIGYRTQEVVAGKDPLVIVLMPDETSLSEVVVVGYGTQIKRAVTGSISSVDLTKSADLPNVNITQSLNSVPGLQFNGNGRPGQDGSILIRGQNSLLTGVTNNPLIVLDGIIFNGSLSDINPNDIQSLDILKDASSAAIYGSRAANGVILVSSKKGVSEKPSVKANLFNGVSDYASKVQLLSPERYLQRVLDYRTQSGIVADPALISTYINKTEAENYKNNITHDPWDEASQSGKIGSYDLSVSGQSKFTNYYLSASHSDEKGLIFNDNQKRTSLRTNIDNRINSWLGVGINATFAHRNLSGENATLENAYVSSPFGTWYYADGEPTQYVVAEEQVSINPVRSSLLTTNEEVYDNLFSNFYAKLDAPFLKGLSYRINFSPNYRWRHNYNFFRQDKYLTNNTTNAGKLDEKTFEWVLENILTYKKEIGKDHSLDLTLLYGRNHSEFEGTTTNANLLSIDALGYNDLSLGSIPTNSSSALASEGISSMARLNYAFKNKYILTMTARRDGSSVFAANNKYAVFPSGAFAWVISDEPFLKKLNFVDMLKLRLSYGSVGNQAISPYQSLSLSGITQYVYGDGGTTSTGVFPSTIGNEDLKWETTYTANAGIDFDLFKGRLGGSIEFYNSNTKDLLVRRSIPVMTGFTSILTNIGTVNNRGIEVSLNSVNVKSRNFQWSSNISFTHNKNKIVELFGSDVNGDGKEDDDVANSWFIGQPINSYFDYEMDGIYQEGDQIPAGYKPGWVRLKDLNGDGKLDASDRKIVGSGVNPKYQIGLRNNFSYGNLSLSVFINTMQGWVSPFSLLNPGTTGRSLNQLDDGWWTSANKSNTRASLVYTNPLKHSWYVSRDFLRIQDVSLAYNFSGPVLQKIHMNNLRVFVNAKNLYTFTDWLGSDPESGGNTASTLFPMPRMVTLGLNMGF